MECSCHVAEQEVLFSGTTFQLHLTANRLAAVLRRACWARLPAAAPLPTQRRGGTSLQHRRARLTLRHISWTSSAPPTPQSMPE